MRFLLLLLACCWVATGTVAAAKPVAAAKVAEIDWSQEVFVIPYQWSSQRDPDLAKEVILYVAAGDGRQWSEVTRASPRVQSFRYRAPRDGRYAFAVRTLDSRGRLWPKGGLTPELVVRVDTQIPRVSLSGTVDSSGVVLVRCDIREANLNTSAVRLEARVAGGEWRPLRFMAGLGGSPGVVRLEARWQSPGNGQSVELRAEVKDRAGNPAMATAVAEATVASLPPAGDSPVVQQSVAASSDPFLKAPPIELPAAGNWATAPPALNQPPALQQTPPPAGEEWPADATAGTPFNANDPGTWRSAPGDDRELPRVAMTNTAKQSVVFGAPSLERSPYQLASAGPRPTPPPAEPPPRDTPAVRTAGRVPLMHVNRPTFALDYQLQSVDRWGVSRVEAWGTANGGQTWRKYAIDNDQQSPVTISTPGAGRYGFRIVVQAVSGLPAEPPRPGDAPELLVQVDLEPPEVQLVSARQGEGHLGDHLIVRWRADDAALADRPISLWFSHRPDGPWSPIASRLANTGEYAWRLRRHLPHELFVKLQAEDRAGNTSAVQNDVPAPLNFSTPAATLHGARAVAR